MSRLQPEVKEGWRHLMVLRAGSKGQKKSEAEETPLKMEKQEQEMQAEGAVGGARKKEDISETAIHTAAAP